MLNSTKAKIAALLSGSLLALAGGTASSVTFSYPNPANCSSITIASSGAISCVGEALGSPLIKFTFSGPISCAGLAIAANGAVSCAAVPEGCILTASKTTVNPGEQITLTASGCTPTTPTAYSWTGSGLATNSTTVPIATVTLPLTASTGPYPYSVVASNGYGAGATAGKTVNVEITGYKGPFAYIAQPSGTLSVVDTTKNTVASVTGLGVGGSLVGVAVNPAGTRVYVTGSDNTVSVIDTANNQLVPVKDPYSANSNRSYIYVDVGVSPRGIAVNPSGTKVYVANSGSDNVSVIDAVSSVVIKKPVTVGSTPYGVAVSPDGSKVYVTNYAGKSVSVINTADDSVLYSVAISGNNPFNKPYGIAVNPNGTQIYVANEGDGTVSVINAKDDTVYRKVPVGNSPRGVAVKPDGTKVYVVNGGDRTASVIDVTNTEMNPYPVATLEGLGELSNFIAFNPAGTLAYVTNAGVSKPGDLAAIDAAAPNPVPSTVSVGVGLTSFGNFVGPAIAVNPLYYTPSYMGLWWNKDEGGWGMSITQHANLNDMIFAVIYTYEQGGSPVWYVMSSCPLAAKACTGKIYKVSGCTSPAMVWSCPDNTTKVVTEVGNGTLTFSDGNNGKFDYTIGGKTGSKLITRQLFGTAITAPATDYSDLWWNPNESGWGIALTHRSDIIFATWYAYDAVGKPIWYVASNCAVSGNVCTGDLYQVSGGTPLTDTWNDANKKVNKVGSATITFSGPNNGSMRYSIDGGVSFLTREITRQLF